MSISFSLQPYITWQNFVNWLGTWNVRGDKRIAKREVVNVFRKEKFRLRQLKGNGGVVSWYEVNDDIAGVKEIERAGGGVAVLLNVWHSALIHFEYVSSRIM